MKIASLDKSMMLTVASPGLGAALTLAGHVWLLDRNGVICSSIPPENAGRHLAVREIERCPACVAFVVLDRW